MINVCERLQTANSIIRTSIISVGKAKSSKDASALLMESASQIHSAVKGLGVLKNQDVLDLRSRIALISKQFKSLADSVRAKRVAKPELTATLSSIATKSKELNQDIVSVQTYLDHSEEIAAKQVESEYKAELAEFKRTQELRAKNGLSTEVDENGDPIIAPVRKIVRDDGREAAARSSILINGYSAKYADKVPAKVKLLHVETLPIYVKFGNTKVTLERLRNLGIKAEPLSTINVGSTDIGICLDAQVIGFFKASDAEKFNANYYSVQERDRRTNITVIKNLKRKATKLNRSIDDIVVKGRALKKAGGSKTELVDLTRQKRILEAQVQGVMAQIQKLESVDKTEKSTIAAVQRFVSKTRDSQVLNYAEHLVSLINEKSAQKYSLVTATFMHKLGEDSGLVAMWMMPTPTYRLLLDLASTGLNVKHWNWPWAL